MAGPAAGRLAGPAQQAPQPGWPGQNEPDSHLVWAILCTVLCCLPLGIVSIVHSTKVSGLWAQGRYAEAQSAADSAKKWAIIGAVVGAVSYVIGIVLWFAFVAAVVVSTIPSITTTTYSLLSNRLGRHSGESRVHQPPGQGGIGTERVRRTAPDMPCASGRSGG